MFMTHSAQGNTIAVDIRRAASRFHTEADWLDSWHSFSFGPHHDAKNTGHGLLVVLNDDIVLPGKGFGRHPHKDMEIVTWVLDGELEHRDSLGNHGIIYPGLSQRMSAGAGIQHSEMNPGRDKPVHFVQMWVLPDTEGIQPGYEQKDVSSELNRGDLIPVASGKDHDGAIRIHQKDAVLWAGRLAAGTKVTIPSNTYVHVFIATGEAELEGNGLLGKGDAARLYQAGSLALTAGKSGAEVLVWETA